jgi:50S ribosomal protein L16 3-hydroxylase
MINLPIELNQFLTKYWQKKPLLIKGGFKNFNNPLSPEEMAGLSLEEEVESRIVVQKGENNYQLLNGPFSEQTYQDLPEKNWTLLIQGMDKLIPEVADLLTDFDFIPKWRIDDIMVSYATEGGNVGPHYDHYDVFLLQAQGKRQWQLSSQDCNLDNYIQGVDLRLMEKFIVEDDYICEAGDILYLPPLWGHHGISLTDDCMTFSIGYRNYKGLELWDSFGDYLAESDNFKDLYKDPNWINNQPGQISDASWQQAQTLLKSVLDNDDLFKQWFGRFATQLDEGSAEQLPEPLAEDEIDELSLLINSLTECESIQIDPVCRFAYYEENENVTLYINSAKWNLFDAETSFIKLLCNQKNISGKQLQPYLKQAGNQALLNDLWSLQFFEILN